MYRFLQHFLTQIAPCADLPECYGQFLCCLGLKDQIIRGFKRKKLIFSRSRFPGTGMTDRPRQINFCLQVDLMFSHQPQILGKGLTGAELTIS